MNPKSDGQILMEICDNLNKLNYTKDSYATRLVEKHQFEDGFIVESNLRRQLIGLYYENKQIGILGFSVKKGNLNIDGLQGIPNKKIKYPSNWYEHLLNPLIISSIKAYENPINLSQKLTYDIISSKALESRIEEIKINLEKARKEVKNLKKTPENEIAFRRLEYNEKQLILQNNRLLFTKKVRDDYFTKEGFLNLNKARVISIVKAHTNHLLHNHKAPLVKPKPKVVPIKKKR